jgi:hypothetical protein
LRPRSSRLVRSGWGRGEYDQESRGHEGQPPLGPDCCVGPGRESEHRGVARAGAGGARRTRRGMGRHVSQMAAVHHRPVLRRPRDDRRSAAACVPGNAMPSRFATAARDEQGPAANLDFARALSPSVGFVDPPGRSTGATLAARHEEQPAVSRPECSMSRIATLRFESPRPLPTGESGSAAYD